MTNPTSDPDRQPVSWAAWRLLGFLTFLNVLNFVDRVLIASLAPLLIADLGLSRAQIGLLAGFGFVFFYSLVGFFLGLAADRTRRISLIAAGVALWSGMTALSGLARNFAQLAIYRVFVGVGEATLTPAAMSMLGDLFPARRLGLASGVYYAGIPLGTAASLIASSYLAPRYGWRACFFILGGIGLAAALVVLLFREPVRRGASAAAARPPLATAMGEAWRALGARRDLAWTLVGGSLLCYGAAAALHNVTWLVEERGLPYAEAAFTAGLIGVAAGFVGNLAGGAFADRCAHSRPDGHLLSLLPMTVFFASAAFVFYLLPAGAPLFYLFWFLAAAGTSAWFGPLFAAIQRQAPAHARATTIAVALLAMNLFGVGPGPLVTGWLGDRFGLTLGLRASLVVVALAIVPFALALRAGRRAALAPSA